MVKLLSGTLLEDAEKSMKNHFINIYKSLQKSVARHVQWIELQGSFSSFPNLFSKNVIHLIDGQGMTDSTHVIISTRY